MEFSIDQDFAFVKRFGNINWNQVKHFDIDSVAKAGDLEQLTPLLENLTFSLLDKADLERISDTKALKVFRLCQLTVEHLFNVQNKLVKLGNKCEGEVTQFSHENIQSQTRLNENLRKIESLEIQIKEKTTQIPKKNAKFPCSQCKKIFISAEYRDKHVQRRHTKTDFSADIQEFVQQHIQIVKQANDFELKNIKDSLTHEINQQKKILEGIHAQESKEKHDNLVKEREKLKSFLTENNDVIREHEQKIESIKKTHEELILKKANLEQVITELTYSPTEKQDITGKSNSIQLVESESIVDIDIVPQKINTAKNLAKKPDNIENPINNTDKQLNEKSPRNENETDRIEPIQSRDTGAKPPSQESSHRKSARVHDSNAGALEDDEDKELSEIIDLDNYLEEAAEEIGIDLSKYTRYAFIAEAYKAQPLPDDWEEEEPGIYINRATGEISEDHPGPRIYNKMFRDLKRQHRHLARRLRTILEEPSVKSPFNQSVISHFDNSDCFEERKAFYNNEVQTKLTEENIETLLSSRSDIDNLFESIDERIDIANQKEAIQEEEELKEADIHIEYLPRRIQGLETIESQLALVDDEEEGKVRGFTEGEIVGMRYLGRNSIDLSDGLSASFTFYEMKNSSKYQFEVVDQ